MNRTCALQCAIFAAALFSVSATAIAAPAEQWLQYRTDREGQAYRWLQPATNPPANVALPTLSGPGYYVRWTTPMDPSGGRWICLDRTRKSGPHNRLFIDSNGNGRLDDEKPIVASRVDEDTAYFDAVRVLFKGEDGPIMYHITLRFTAYEGSSPYLLAQSAGSYEGSVDFGGKKQRIQLVDGNVNGTFNDQGADTSDRDWVTIQGDSTSRRYLGRMIEVSNQLFRIEVARDGACITVEPARDVVFGEVRVPETISQLVVLGPNGHFVRKPARGVVSLPIGEYRIFSWDMQRKDEKGAAWTLSGAAFDERGDIEVAANTPLAVNIGEPIRAMMGITDATNEIRFSLEMRGALGERVDIMKGGQTPPGPKLFLASADGTYRATNSFEFG